jgi:ABC-type branched-subunit amino acid transport system substrate-binding protein
MASLGRLRFVFVVALIALFAAGCRESDGGGGGQENGNGEVKTDIGITEEPCPDAVNEDHGCIYLGILSDLTEGPFAALAVPITDAQEAFWKRVNEEGGIGDTYDVDVTKYTRDNKYNPEVHVQRYQQIEPHILALAQTLGTPMTLAGLPFYKRQNVVGAPASWWSGWEFEDNILESGSNYCLESMNAVDYAVQEFDAKTVMAVHYPGDYGGDAAIGAEYAAGQNDVDFLKAVETGPNAVVGSQEAAMDAILQGKPDLVILTTGPAEAAEIVGGTAARGFTGKFIGTEPTWNPGLLESPAAEALVNLYLATYPWPPFGSDTPGHDAMSEALGDVTPNDGYTAGWVWSYPLKAALEAAFENGDLTREGMVQAASELETVDYEGMLPEEAGKFSGEPSDTVFREHLIVKPDPEAAAGVSVVEDSFVGPTAEAYDFSEVCQPVEEG